MFFFFFSLLKEIQPKKLFTGCAIVHPKHSNIDTVIEYLQYPNRFVLFDSLFLVVSIILLYQFLCIPIDENPSGYF